MPKPPSIDRLTDQEALTFRRLMARVMDLKGLSISDVTDKLEWDDEQRLRNALKSGVHTKRRSGPGRRPLLAPTALAIGQAVAGIGSRRGLKRGLEADRLLLKYWHAPCPEWLTRYRLGQAGPAVHIPIDQIRRLAEAISNRLGRSPAARRRLELSASKFLTENAEKMAISWRERSISNYAGPFAAQAARDELEWSFPWGGRVIRPYGNGGRRDVQIVVETGRLLVDLARPNLKQAHGKEAPRRAHKRRERGD